MINTLVGRFHAHITFVSNNDDIQCPKGWKSTIIVLNKDNREQRDVMITRHFMLGSAKNPTFASIHKDCDLAKVQLGVAGYTVVRVKIEHEDLPTLPPSDRHYRECHIKIRKPVTYNIVPVEGFVESRNAMEVTDTHSVVFMNARYYRGTVSFVDWKTDTLVQQFKDLNPTCEVLEVKKESTVFDTNLNLDKWWA